MRLHSLSVSAFGPFAGTERVDFDELNDAGLFLLTGPTGAGKSSLLDAVCFALYGTVPGARGVKTLKSQHAPADARPEVVLDVTVQSRRFLIRRSPEWTRPKKRGTGLALEKASASITETTGGVEHFLSARAAEVGLLVHDLMGMSAGQFVQVALLPQGEFQTFLRASSQERHDVLQQLFGTDRFARIEDWVHERSRRLKGEAAVGESAVQRILDTVADRAATHVPDALSGEALPVAAAEGEVLPWLGATLCAARTDAGLARGAHDVARADLTSARLRLEVGTRQAEQRLRRVAADRTLAALAESEPTALAARAALEGHQRATRCLPVLELHARAQLNRERAADDRDAAVRALAGAQAPDGLLVDDLAVEGAATAEQLSSATERVRDRRVRLETLLPRERVAVDAAHSRDDDLGRLDAARLDLRSISLRAEEIPGEIAAAAASLTAASKRAGRHEALTAALLAARVRHEAAVELDDVRLRLDARQDTRRGARDRAQDARELLQDLVSRRLAGMAAELAGALVDGAACQVCGSLQHPLPATPAADAVTDADHDRAERELSAASVSLEAAESAVRALQGRHDTLVAGAGGVSAREGARMVASLADELAESQAAGAVRDTLDAAVRALRDEQLGIGRRQTAAAAMAAGLVQSVAAHERTVAAFAAEAEALFDGPMAVGSLALALRTLTAWSGLLGRAERVVVALDTAQAQLESIGEQVSATAAEHGFAGRAEVAVALLGRDARDHLGEMLQGRSETEARVRAVLDDLPDPSDPSDGPASSEVPGVPGVPGVDALRSTVREAEAAAGDAARVQALHDDRLAALTRQLDRVTEVMADWAPVRDEALRAEGISRLVRGTGHDNQLQMRLSAYVLATRLDQVVAAANERLGQLRDQRYLLQRTDRAERRGSQAGLGLQIVDQWTGDVRSPSTLSGGETFVVSLSLALGLADVVTHESGGTEIETLFVDEGFGTLDADTLDDVMDGLDGLRAGGRTVGVVSHVTELRSRIPTQVQVDKGRDGSTVSVRTLVG